MLFPLLSVFICSKAKQMASKQTPAAQISKANCCHGNMCSNSLTRNLINVPLSLLSLCSFLINNKQLPAQSLLLLWLLLTHHIYRETTTTVPESRNPSASIQKMVTLHIDCYCQNHLKWHIGVSEVRHLWSTCYFPGFHCVVKDKHQISAC